VPAPGLVLEPGPGLELEPGRELVLEPGLGPGLELVPEPHRQPPKSRLAPILAKLTILSFSLSYLLKLKSTFHTI